MSTFAEVANRWDKFLASIQERFRTVLQEARAGCAQLLVDNEYDTHAFGIAWSAMAMRASQLSSKLEDTWDDKVSPRFDALDLDPGVVDQQRAKGDALALRMEVELEGMRVRVFADAARAVWGHAVSAAPPQLSCSQCGAPMAVPNALGSVNVTCASCSGVVTYVPGPRLRAIEHFCVHPLAEEASWQHWLARHAAEQALRAAPLETLDLLKAYEHTQIEYWRAYLATRAQMLPSHAAAFDKDLRGRMQQWYDSVQRSRAWIAGGCPRAIP